MVEWVKATLVVQDKETPPQGSLDSCQGTSSGFVFWEQIFRSFLDQVYPFVCTSIRKGHSESEFGLVCVLGCNPSSY